ncbi:MAG TPA: shikimate kinase AroK [Gammaproteobacteria bacterium]|nr:shikimate kinase AroK [Gammaproteobacteria bacterium]
MKHLSKQNIFLIGPMAAGKSSIGRSLAKRLAKRFYDSDLEIEKRTGVDLRWIFDLEGETGFRQRESAIIADLSKQSNIVLATGGGSIIAAENRKLLATNGIVVYLRVSLACQLQRLVADDKRPLLKEADRPALLLKLIQEREPLYLELAHFSVETDEGSIASVAKKIVELLGPNLD